MAYNAVELIHSFPAGSVAVALVLCANTDDALQHSRVLILEQAGHEVISVKGEQELIAACQEHQFEVAVIGQGVPKNEKRRALRLLKQHCPNAKVLELVAPGAGRVLDGANDWLEVPGRAPAELARRVSLLGSKAERA